MGSLLMARVAQRRPLRKTIKQRVYHLARSDSRPSSKGTPFAKDRRAVKDRHPVIIKWSVKRAKSGEAARRGKGGELRGFNNLDRRQHHILSTIFFEVEKHGVSVGSFGHPEFHFEYQGTITVASIAPINPKARRPDAKLRFVIEAPSPNPDGFVVHAEWLEADERLEQKVPEIVGTILAATRALARAYREKTRASLEAAIRHLLDKLKGLGESKSDGFAARCDPRTFEILVEMAERHRTATALRRFLRLLSKKITDETVVVADLSLEDWIRWAATKADEFDPLVQGSEYVFEKLLKS